MDHSADDASPYRIYWIAWTMLLALTLIMVFLAHPAVLLLGIMVKITIIALWFMHLKYEVKSFQLIVASSILVTGVLLYALIAPDGMSM